MAFTASRAAVAPAAGSYFRSISRTTVAISSAPSRSHNHPARRASRLAHAVLPYRFPDQGETGKGWMSLVAGHPPLSGNQPAGLVTISTAASGVTPSGSARRPTIAIFALAAMTSTMRPVAPGNTRQLARFRVQSRGSKPTRTVIPQSVRDIEVFWPERAGFRAPVQPSRTSSGHIPAALAQANPWSSPSPAALVRRAGCGAARSGQPSFTAVPEALTISMLLPTVS